MVSSFHLNELPLAQAYHQKNSNRSQNMVQALQWEIRNRKSQSFDELIQEWQEKYQASVFHPLVQIASDRKNEDADRYVALMTAAKLGGSASIPMLVNLLKDRSWMMKAGALQALAIVRHPSVQETALNPNGFSSEIILPLLHDPALVVRAEAVQAIKVLKPKGAVAALIEALNAEENYHGGKAQWVPQKVLSAIVELKAKETAPQLLSLLEHPRHQRDSEFLSMTVRTLELLTGRKSKTRATLADQIKDWKQFLSTQA